MALTDIQSPWRKQNCHILLTNAITTAPTAVTATFTFRNVGMGPWPRAMKPLNEYDHQNTSYPMRDANDYGLGIVRPAFTLELPFTATAYAFAVTSLLQNKAAGAVPPPATALCANAYTDPQAKWFFCIETSLGTVNASRQVYGSIVKSLTVSIPPADASGGHPTLKMDCIAAYGRRALAPLATATLHTGKPCLSTDWSFLLAGSTRPFAGAEFTVTNNADWSPHVGANADMFNLGKLDITGNVKVAVSTNATDAWAEINDSYEAGTSINMEFDYNDGVSTHTAKFPVILPEEPGEPGDQSNVSVATVPFKAIYKDTDEPGFVFPLLLSTFATWT